jgi:hypothetical protein
MICLHMIRLRRRPTRRLDWSSARTLADLGELTARYLLGEAEESPTHCGPPDPETASIADRLAALNRTGLVVTYGSQPGEIDEYGRQRAFVDLFCSTETLARVGAACRGAGLMVLAHEPGTRPPLFPWQWPSVPVTEDAAGHVYTDAGGWLPPDDVALFHRRAGCRREMIAALLSCHQVTIYDPEWGRPDLLWDVLADALGIPP